MFESRDGLKESLKVKTAQMAELAMERDCLRVELGKMASELSVVKKNYDYAEKERKLLDDKVTSRGFEIYALTTKYEELVKSLRADLKIAQETIALKNEYIRARDDIVLIQEKLDVVTQKATELQKNLEEMQEKAATERL